MKNANRYLLTLMLLLMTIFVIGKMLFIYYNQDVYNATGSAIWSIISNGLLLDLRTTALLLIIPTLTMMIIRRGLRWVLVPYFCFIAFAMGAIIVADMVMYEFWEFKLCAVHLAYAASPEGTTNSVSTEFLVVRGLLIFAITLAVAVPAIRITPRHAKSRRHWMMPIAIVVLALLPIGVGNCYHHGPLFLSHAATNPMYRFAASFFDSNSFRNDGVKETDSIAVTRAYHTDDNITDTLLNTQRPNVLFVMMESFGGKFVEELGGIPGVAPNMSRLIPEGIFFDRYYSNSFRTDRGTVCAFSGWTSYPDISPMKEARMHTDLTSLSTSFRKAGYQTGYMYAGKMTNMGKYRYLADMGFESLMDDSYFKKEELNTGWGANDSTAAMKMYHTIAEIDSSARWMMVLQTISSHEPWDVPYQRLEDKKLNAFAYTDQCVGDLVDSLRTLPVWDKLLVIIIPDHGFLYEQTYDNSEFFHSPMLWTGGAIKSSRRIHTLMNQSDIAATLMAQMGQPTEEYMWSRNVFSPDYKPFVYCNYPAGILYKDETGETMYDISAKRSLPIDEPVDDVRLQKGLQILRHSYNQLQK